MNAGYFSQFGEDVLLHKIFGGKSSGVAIEVGGNDGVLNSNTFHFEQIGWRTVIIEPIPDLCAIIRERRPNANVVECAASDREGICDFRVAMGVDGMSTMIDNPSHLLHIQREGGALKTISVQTRTLDHIFSSLQVHEIDFITIDVEGAESLVLRGLTLSRFRPRIIITEDNSFGKDQSVERHLAAKGYVNFHRTVVNDWFVLEGDIEILSQFDLPSFQKRKRKMHWHRRGKVIANMLPGFLRRAVKRVVGQAPFSDTEH